ncbi:MAG: MoxR family ATPase [Chloroflexota bacterium]
MNKPTGVMASEIAGVSEAATRFNANVGKVIVGKSDVIEFVLAALLTEGHILIEDVPGIGKTVLARTVAKSLGLSFKRIQFTPDLLPSDVTGIYYFNQKSSEFEFRPGPIMANIILADEINRATPRTQSCLLECMQERQITVDRETMPLPRPFLIIATQNPIELEGTFPLPEAQLDRFLMKLRLGYPSFDEEKTVIERFQEASPLDSLESVITADELLELQKLCRRVQVHDSLRSYIVQIVHSTRNHEGIELGASPRASLGLLQASQSLAAIKGRGYVIPDDIKRLAVPVLTHRLTARTEARLRGHSLEETVAEVVKSVPVPVE